jgi:hypothetical protein
MKMKFSQKRLGLATQSAYQKKREMRNGSNGRAAMGSSIGPILSGSRRGVKRKSSYHRDDDFSSSDNDEG